MDNELEIELDFELPFDEQPVKVDAKKDTFKEEIIKKVADGSIVNTKRITKEVNREELVNIITIINDNKLNVSIDYRESKKELILSGKQAGLVAVLLLLNEN